MINNSIKVNYSVYDDHIGDILSDILSKHDPIACDFETSTIYNQKVKEIAKTRKKYSKDWETIRECDFVINTNGLSSVHVVRPTHLSVAWSERDAAVFVLTQYYRSTRIVCDLLVDTKVKQIWHNASYDFSFIYYFTHKYPSNFEDTMLLVKCLTTNVKTYKSPAGLKELEGNYYGKWAIAKDSFTQENSYNSNLLEYSATDACATYHLYQRIIEELNSEPNRLTPSKKTV